MALTLSAAQWQQIGQSSFERRMLQLIREDYPELSAPYSDDDIVRQIRRQAVKAQGYGLHDEQSAAIYVLTAWLLGPDFDTEIPALRQVLNAPELSAASKAQALIDFTTTLLWQLQPADPASR